MAKNLITKIEDKYVFTMSTLFWHIFVVVAAVGIVAGVVLFILGVIPSFKSSPKKEKYPPVAVVSLKELRAVMIPADKSPKEIIAQKQKEYVEQITEESQISPGLVEFQAVMETLRNVLPESHYLWKSKGKWYYPYGEQYYLYYLDESYRRWIITTYGIPERINQALNKASIISNLEKKQFVSACIKFLQGYELEKRGQPFDAALNSAQGGISKSVSNITLLVSLRDKIFKERTDLLINCADFISRNPTDGANLLEYSLSVIASFDTIIRPDVVLKFMTSYSLYFNNSLNRQEEFTNLFLPLAKSFEPNQQISALEKYYNLALEKNASRELEIKRVDFQYESELAEAEHKFQATKAKKSEQRLWGLYGVGAGIGTIAFVALLLVLLSIQRYVRKIVEHQDLKLTSTPKS